MRPLLAALPTAPPPGKGATRAPYAAFSAFGVFWGAWGAGLPALRTQAGISEGQLGTALLFVELGALPAMTLTGRLVDRFGLRTGGWLLIALGGAGLLVAGAARGMPSLVAGMLVVGAASGAADVAINTLAGRAEHTTARPLLARSHGLFSIGVVGASLVTGGLLGADLPLPVVFAAVAIAMLLLSVAVLHAGTSYDGPVDRADPGHGAAGPAARLARTAGPLVVVGLVAALAYAVENAHQSWGALVLTDVLAASPPVAAAAPAAFAATAALARLTLAPLSRSHPTALLVGGGALATVGSAVLAAAPSAAVALAGLALAALGTATLFPTLLSCSLRGTDPARHGRATSVVATTAYLGFLLGPAYVGLLAETNGLRGGIVGVAALAAVLTLAAAPVSAWSARRTTRPG